MKTIRPTGVKRVFVWPGGRTRPTIIPTVRQKPGESRVSWLTRINKAWVSLNGPIRFTSKRK